MSPTTPSNHPEPIFHSGELALQQLTGVQELMAPRGQAMIRDHMPDQHRMFFEQLPMVIVGGLDDSGQPWATVWSGAPGFMQSPDAQTLQVRPHQLSGDPLTGPWQAGRPIGLLGIEPHTRRRNRMNGTLTQHDAHQTTIAVRQSFGNCPKYIQTRLVQWQAPEPGPDTAAALVQREGPVLSDLATAMVEQADAFFIASRSARAGQPGQTRSDGVDVSHRGGPPGFVRLASRQATELVVPDYTGNFMFNTLGNILQDPRVGLLFMSEALGAVLWLAGQARLDLDSDEVQQHPGAQRLLRIEVLGGWLRQGALPITWP